MRTGVVALVAAGVLAGCASGPDEIPAQYVSHAQYMSFDCEQMELEAVRVNARKAALYHQAKKQADADAVQMGVGLVLFWPALFFLEGGDGPIQAEYGRLQGESDALERAAVVKKCQALSQWQPPVAEPASTSRDDDDDR